MKFENSQEILCNVVFHLHEITGTLICRACSVLCFEIYINIRKYTMKSISTSAGMKGPI